MQISSHFPSMYWVKAQRKTIVYGYFRIWRNENKCIHTDEVYKKCTQKQVSNLKFIIKKF